MVAFCASTVSEVVRRALDHGAVDAASEEVAEVGAVAGEQMGGIGVQRSGQDGAVLLRQRLRATIPRFRVEYPVFPMNVISCTTMGYEETPSICCWG